MILSTHEIVPMCKICKTGYFMKDHLCSMIVIITKIKTDNQHECYLLPNTALWKLSLQRPGLPDALLYSTLETVSFSPVLFMETFRPQSLSPPSPPLHLSLFLSLPSLYVSLLSLSPSQGPSPLHSPSPSLWKRSFHTLSPFLSYCLCPSS